MLLYLLLACSDQKLSANNTEPSAAILSHDDGDVVTEDTVVTFTGSVADGDHAASELEIRWYAGETSVCGPETPDEGGTTVCAIIVRPDETIRLEVRDPVGASDSDTVQLDVQPDEPGDTGTAPADDTGEPPDTDPPDDTDTEPVDTDTGEPPDTDPPENTDPTCALTAPADGGSSAVGEEITFRGEVADVETPAADLDVAWSSDRDGALGGSTPDSDGDVIFLYGALSEGSHLLTLEVGDGDGGVCSDVIAWSVTNGRPGAPSVVISPDPASTGDDLLANITAAAVDPEGDAVTYVYAWTRDGAATAYTDDSVPASATSAGETWAVEVTPSDAGGAGAAGSDTLTIGNTAPAVDSVSLSPDPVYTGDTLTAGVVTSDDDGDSVSLSYAWYVNSALTGGDSPTLDGATAFDKGDDVFVEVTPSDAGGAGVSLRSDTLTVANTPPGAPIPQIDPLSPVEGEDDLLCQIGTASTDADGDTVSYIITWDVDGLAYGGAGDTFISGDTVDGGDTSGGEIWTCTATPDDGDDAGLAGTDSVTIGDFNDRPGAPTVDISPDPADTDDDLDASITVGAVDPEGDAVTYAYVWTRDGASTSYTSTSVPASATTAGETWRVEVTPSDAGGAGTVGSDELTISNTAPSVTDVTVSPDPAYTDDTLEAFVSFEDIDGDGVSLAFAWYVNGSLTGGDSESLSGSAYFDKGDMVRVEVTPSDSDGAGDTVTSDVITVSNTAPTAPSVRIDPNDPEEGTDDLVCLIDVDSTDADGDAVSYLFEWDVGGAAFYDAVDTYETGDTVDGADTTGGDVWTCEVTPDDGDDIGPSDSDTVTVASAVDGKLVFISSETFNGGFGGVTGADSECQSMADAAGHSGTFKAWLSGSSTSSSPSSRFTRSTSDPYVLIDGTVIADDWNDLTDGEIQNPINLDEYGGAAVSSLVFTFVRIDGTPGLFESSSSNCYGNDCHCDEWTSTDSSSSGGYDGSAVGQSNTTASEWTDYSFYNGCGYDQPIYCFQQ